MLSINMLGISLYMMTSYHGYCKTREIFYLIIEIFWTHWTYRTHKILYLIIGIY